MHKSLKSQKDVVPLDSKQQPGKKSGRGPAETGYQPVAKRSSTARPVSRFG